MGFVPSVFERMEVHQNNIPSRLRIVWCVWCLIGWKMMMRRAGYPVIRQTAPKLGVAEESLRRWVEQAEIDAGEKSGVSTDTAAEIRKLKRENAELRRSQ